MLLRLFKAIFYLCPDQTADVIRTVFVFCVSHTTKLIRSVLNWDDENQQSMRTVTDEEIATALNVLAALKDQLKAQTKRRMDRVPNNVSWNEKLTWIDFDLRGSLESIHCLKLELKHWIKTTSHSSSGQLSHLTMQSPTTAKLCAAIVVLEPFGEHINHAAANTVIEWPAAQHYEHYAAKIEAWTIEQTDLIQTVGAQWYCGATNCCRGGGSVFFIMFNTRHA